MRPRAEVWVSPHSSHKVDSTEVVCCPAMENNCSTACWLKKAYPSLCSLSGGVNEFPKVISTMAMGTKPVIHCLLTYRSVNRDSRTQNLDQIVQAAGLQLEEPPLSLPVLTLQKRNNHDRTTFAICALPPQTCWVSASWCCWGLAWRQACQFEAGYGAWGPNQATWFRAACWWVQKRSCADRRAMNWKRARVIEC